MKILVDTQVALWMAVGSKKLKASTVKLLTGIDTTRFFSAVSAWEIAVKWRLGKLPLPDHPRIWVSRMMKELALEALPILHAHVVRTADLPDHHRDPFDRILIAQAKVEGAAVATADKLLRKYDIEVLPAA